MTSLAFFGWNLAHVQSSNSRSDTTSFGEACSSRILSALVSSALFLSLCQRCLFTRLPWVALYYSERIWHYLRLLRWHSEGASVQVQSPLKYKTSPEASIRFSGCPAQQCSKTDQTASVMLGLGGRGGCFFCFRRLMTSCPSSHGSFPVIV